MPSCRELPSLGSCHLLTRRTRACSQTRPRRPNMLCRQVSANLVDGVNSGDDLCTTTSSPSPTRTFLKRETHSSSTRHHLRQRDQQDREHVAGDPDDLLDFKPHEKVNTIRAILVHQILSERRSSLSSSAPRSHPSKSYCRPAISPRCKPTWRSTSCWRRGDYRSLPRRPRTGG